MATANIAKLRRAVKNYKNKIINGDDLYHFCVEAEMPCGIAALFIAMMALHTRK